jgi:hypothetical protein
MAALHGVTASPGGVSSEGTVFKLTPPANGHTAWTKTVLYSFKGSPSDGANPAGLIADKQGALYSTTALGGSGCPQNTSGCGTVFKLTPPAKGQTTWTEASASQAFFARQTDHGFPFDYRFRPLSDNHAPVAIAPSCVLIASITSLETRRAASRERRRLPLKVNEGFKVERPGKYFAPFGGLIPAAGRLLLAITETLAQRAGL